MTLKERIFDTLPDNTKQNIVLQALDFPKRLEEDCQNCAACCVAFSIPGVKEHGEPCPNLIKDGNKRICKIYERRFSDCKYFDCKKMKTNTPLQKRRIVELLSARELLLEQK